MELHFCNRIVKQKFPTFDVVSAEPFGIGRIRCEGVSEREFHAVKVKSKTGNVTGFAILSSLVNNYPVTLFHDHECKNKMLNTVKASNLVPVSEKILVKKVVKKVFTIDLSGTVSTT